MERNLEDSGNFSFKSKSSMLPLIALMIFVLLVLGALSALLFLNGQNTKKASQNIEKNNFEAIAPYTIVYGYWVGDNQTYINGVDLNTGKILNIAQLPVNVKKVSITSPQTLIFINNTDIRDHGTEIASYDISTKLITSLISVAPGFGIDDYVISPNKRYIALWEVSIPQDKDLSFGVSRVYAVDLESRQVKNLIYDENLQNTQAAHYPVGITDTGEVFMDTFRPNAGAGWANGMSVSNLSGTQKQDIASMQSGTYSTQPQLSPDGNYLAFAGYSGNLGAGTATVGSSDGFRQAILSPNTVEMLNTTTKQRTKIESLSDKNIYPYVSWDYTSGKMFYSLISKDASLNGQYLYDLTAGRSEKIQEIGEGGITSNYSFITSLGNSKILAGQQDQSSSALGNLGKGYAQALKELGVYSKIDKKLTPLSMNASLIQYIDIVPSSFFSTQPQIIGIIGEGSSRNSTDQLQLETFTIKPSLEPIRTVQQSDPPPLKPDLPFCDEYAVAQCNTLLGTNYTVEDTRKEENRELFGCFSEQISIAIKTDNCADSPLYLYGQEGLKVSVYIGTRISNSNAPYNNGYSGVLTGDGGMLIGGKNYSSLEYDYATAIKKLPTLNYGKTVQSSDVESVIREYGVKLGLSSKEIDDTIKSLDGKFNKKYVFISFYDDKTSKVILPISFDPKPDVYRNIIFYLKQLDEPIFSKSPVFENYPERIGFTAVEVSSIID